MTDNTDGLRFTVRGRVYTGWRAWVMATLAIVVIAPLPVGLFMLLGGSVTLDRE